MGLQIMPLDLNDKFSLSHGSITHDVYREGEGPAVVLMHELPGMTPGCLRAATRIVECGFRVYLPLFFGHPNEYSITDGIFSTVLCIRHEFNVFTTHGKSPIAEWLRELCRRADDECGYRGVGLIGMCLTGNVVLSVMLEPSVSVPVMCEPSLPFLHKASLGAPEEDIEDAKQRAKDAPILAFRFASDNKCPKERFDTLRNTFKENICTVEIPTGPENPFDIPGNAHSVLSGDYPNQCDPNHPVQHAFDEILLRFKRDLIQRPPRA
jgi:dienelactone hydrolase